MMSFAIYISVAQYWRLRKQAMAELDINFGDRPKACEEQTLNEIVRYHTVTEIMDWLHGVTGRGGLCVASDKPLEIKITGKRVKVLVISLPPQHSDAFRHHFEDKFEIEEVSVSSSFGISTKVNTNHNMIRGNRILVYVDINHIYDVRRRVWSKTRNLYKYLEPSGMRIADWLIESHFREKVSQWLHDNKVKFEWNKYNLSVSSMKQVKFLDFYVSDDKAVEFVLLFNDDFIIETGQSQIRILETMPS